MRRIGGLLSVVALFLAACGPGGTASTLTTAPPSPVQSSGMIATSGASPEPSRPAVMPRPTDLPIDGSCESDNTPCLGLLKPGVTYHTENFEPPFSFAVPTADWENRSEEGGVVELLSTSAPGDGIAFFAEPRASDPSVGSTVSDLASWLAHDSSLEVTPATTVKIGGLSGVALDVRVAPGATNQDPGCPVLVCVPIFSGHDPDPNDHPQWTWDWGAAGAETQRLYLLAWSKGVISIFVDSLDGATFDALTRAFDQIRPTLRFG